MALTMTRQKTRAGPTTTKNSIAMHFKVCKPFAVAGGLSKSFVAAPSPPPVASLSKPLLNTCTKPSASVNISVATHKKIIKQQRKNLSYCSLQRLARVGGVRRLDEIEENTTKHYFESHLENLISRLAKRVESRGDNVVTVTDVVRVLEELPQWTFAYGFKK